MDWCGYDWLMDDVVGDEGYVMFVCLVGCVIVGWWELGCGGVGDWVEMVVVFGCI